MPAVDRARLEQQIGHLVEVFGDPARLRSRCLDLLEFYASRVRSAAPGGGATARALGVPAPVLRAIEGGLRVPAEADPRAAGMAAETLWTAPVLEARLLAIFLLERQTSEAIPTWVEAWARTAGDAALLQRLASGPLRSLHASDPERFWMALDHYLKDARPEETILGMRALETVLEDLKAEEIPLAFETLGGMRAPEAGEVWRAQVGVVRALARRSAPETARFLIDMIERGRPGATRLVRQTLDGFPPRERDALRQSLRLTGPA